MTKCRTLGMGFSKVGKLECKERGKEEYLGITTKELFCLVKQTSLLPAAAQSLPAFQPDK